MILAIILGFAGGSMCAISFTWKRPLLSWPVLVGYAGLALVLIAFNIK